MHPLLANDGKELESTAVPSDVEHSGGTVSTQGNNTQTLMIHFQKKKC